MKGLKIIVGLVLVVFGAQAQYTQTGGTVGSISAGNSWSNLSNAVTEDNTYATASLSGSQNTDYISITNFGFSIPTSETISGIEVTINKSHSNLFSYVRDLGVQLLKNGSMVGTDRSNGSPWAIFDLDFTYGGAADTWGTTWTPADINKGGFGVAIAAQRVFGFGGTTARVDNVTITVTTAVPLPVELTHFSVANNGSDIQLDWTTSSEIENDYFEIQKSEDGFIFQTIGRVGGQGNTVAITDYQFNDIDPLGGVTYYRLKQVDFDGTTAYSDVEFVSRVEAPKVTMFPNPASEAVMFKNLPEGNNKIEVYNSNGQLVISDMIYNNTPVGTNNLAPGYYVVKLQTGSEVTTEKLIIK